MIEERGPLACRGKNPAAIAVSRTKSEQRRLCRPAPFCTPHSVGDGGDTAWATFFLGGTGGGSQGHEANVDDVTTHSVQAAAEATGSSRQSARVAAAAGQCRRRSTRAAAARARDFATPPTGRLCRWATAATPATRASASTAAAVTACPNLTHTTAVWRLGPTAGRVSLHRLPPRCDLGVVTFPVGAPIAVPPSRASSLSPPSVGTTFAPPSPHTPWVSR